MKVWRKLWRWGDTGNKNKTHSEIVMAYNKWNTDCNHLLDNLETEALKMKQFHIGCKLFKTKVVDDITAQAQQAKFYAERLAYLNQFYEDSTDDMEQWKAKAESLAKQREQWENTLRLMFPKAKRLLSREINIYMQLLAVTEDFILCLRDCRVAHFMLNRVQRFSAVHLYETVHLMNKVKCLLTRNYERNLVYENRVQLPLDGLIGQVLKCAKDLRQIHKQTVQYDMDNMLAQHGGAGITRDAQEISKMDREVIVIKKGK